MKGKIYRLSNGEKHYYGSTTKDLKKRLKQHIYYYENKIKVSSVILFDSVVYNVSIDLMEEIECDDKEDLLWLERWWIENNECVNRYMPIRKDGESEEVSRNTDKRKEYIKEYCVENKDKRNKVSLDFYYKNKKELSKKFICECGCETNKHHIARHRKTKKHIKLMENKTENIII